MNPNLAYIVMNQRHSLSSSQMVVEAENIPCKIVSVQSARKVLEYGEKCDTKNQKPRKHNFFCVHDKVGK